MVVERGEVWWVDLNVSQVITVDRDFLLERAGRLRGQPLKDLENGLRLVLGVSIEDATRTLTA